MLPPQLIPTLIPARIRCLFHCRLKKLEDAFLTLKPTSDENKIIFSNRMNLTDDNLNALVVLRAYYLNEILNI